MAALSSLVRVPKSPKSALNSLIVHVNSQELVQRAAGGSLARLMGLLCAPQGGEGGVRRAGPTDKLVKNLTVLLCADPAVVPAVPASDG